MDVARKSLSFSAKRIFLTTDLGPGHTNGDREENTDESDGKPNLFGVSSLIYIGVGSLSSMPQVVAPPTFPS